MLTKRLAPLFGLMAFAGMTLSQEAKKDEAKKAEAPKVEVKKEEPKKDEAKKDAPAGDKVDFTLKLEKDKPFYQETTTTTTQSIKVMGMDVNQTQKQTFDFKWTPVKEDAGKWTVKQVIEGLKMQIDIAGNPISFDSEASTPGGSNTQLSDFFKSLKGSEFTITLAKGKVEKIEGRDEFLKKLGAANQQMESVIKTILTEEALKQMADPAFGFLPPEGKKVGDKWDNKVTMNLGPIGTYETTYTYTFKSKDPANADLNIIEVQSDVVYKAPADGSPGLPFKIKTADLKTKDKTPGKLVFNSKTGRIESAELVLKIGGTLAVEIGGSTTTVELQQDQATNIKTSDKSYIGEKKN